MRRYIARYIAAIILIGYLPYILFLYFKRYKNRILMSCIGVVLFVVVTIFACNKSHVELDIRDLQAAYNKNTYRTHTDYIVIHHTAGDENGKVSDIATIHMKKNKWNSIGYHFFIAGDGTVYQLRNSDESNVPHAVGYNNNCVAICIAGNFSEKECPKKLWDITLKLTRQMMKRYNINVNHVLAHRELPNNNTECCGLKFNIEQFRKEL